MNNDWVIKTLKKVKSMLQDIAYSRGVCTSPTLEGKAVSHAAMCERCPVLWCNIAGCIDVKCPVEMVATLEVLIDELEERRHERDT